MRLFALRLVSSFTSVYLFQEGFSILFIVLFWASFYGLKVVFSWPGALLIARFGPKHATLVSNIVSAVAMVSLPFVTDPVFGIFALGTWVVLQAYSGAMNDLAYLIDFSKVKDALHAGKELGYMNIVEKVAAGSSPIIGGFIAYIFGAETIMILAAVFFLLSALPLLLTVEPIKLQRGLRFQNYPWRLTARSFVAQASFGFDTFATGIVWSLFLVLVVFVSGTDRVYAEIGVVTSVTVIIALLASYSFGKLIDGRRGGDLLKYSIRLNSALHIARIFVTTPVGVVMANAVNEAATAGYTMPFMRGMFDLADKSGKRIEYLFIMEMAGNFGAMIAALMLAGLLLIVTNIAAIQLFFIITSVAVLFVAFAKYPLYRR
ncbi:hypothetical protein H7142_01265 [Candidatus Saccharibacteria bacterium]|nr:hypothetical protein [Candidatus Saccharibacteria bacterium]